MKKRSFYLIVLLLPLLALAACANPDPEAQPLAPVAGEAGMAGAEGTVSEAEADTAAGVAASHETLVDEQGAVVVSVTPLNVGQDDTTLDFEVALNTHSVDLSMDLAKLASLTSDAGTAVAATTWDAPRGGHHVSGVLSFPVTAALLEGATRITLTLENLDAPARTFTWNLN